MIDWKIELQKYENLKDFNSATKFMQQVIDDEPDNLDAWLLFNYLLMNFLVEEEHENFDVDYYSKLLVEYFHKSYSKFSNVPDYLFYTAITAYMSEWYMELNIDKVDEMLRTALKMDPDNTLYLWGYFSYLLTDSTSRDKSNYYAHIVLNDNSKRQLLLSKGALGMYIMEMMGNQTKNVLF